MDPKREAVAGRVDGFANLFQPIPGVAHDVEDWSEYLALELTDRVDREHMRRKEHAAL